MDFVNIKKYAHVHVVAGKLPEEKTRNAIKCRKTNASKKQHKITEDTLFCAGWIAVITSLGIEYCGEEILYLYRSRWQVELLFKRFKQNLSITTIKAESMCYAETEVLLWLIIWAMTERQVFLAEKYLREKEYETEIYSTYEKCKVSFIEIKEILCMSWKFIYRFFR